LQLKQPRYFEVNSEKDEQTVKELEQGYLFIPQHIKELYLAFILKQTRFETASIIVFTSTCRGAEVVAQFLIEMEIPCVSLHSHKSQGRRMADLGKFRSGLARVMVATDVASRGLDIPTVQLVINYDVPRVVADYIHRVGRTARAGRRGMALTMISQYDVAIFKQIEEAIGVELPEYKTEEAKVLELLQPVSQAKKMAKLHLEDYVARQSDPNMQRRQQKQRDQRKERQLARAEKERQEQEQETSVPQARVGLKRTGAQANRQFDGNAAESAGDAPKQKRRKKKIVPSS
jgi:ATP-dependent RNA helicase DDX49/DBP8